VGCAVAGVFGDARFDDEDAPVRVPADERVNRLVRMFCETFGGTVFDEEDLVTLGRGGDELLAQRVVPIKDAGVVEVLVEPPANVFEVSEVHDEAVVIEPLATEDESESPVMPVDEGAVTAVAVLAVGERDVRVCLRAGEHFRLSTVQITVASPKRFFQSFVNEIRGPLP
jgi:hypothetical protein